MPIIAIDTGADKPVQVQVDDNFTSLSHDEQNATVQRIHDQLVSQQSPSEVSQLPSALAYGASGAASGLGATATDLAGVLQRNNLPGSQTLGSVGSALTGAGKAIAPANYQPAVPAAVAAAKRGEYMKALGMLPRAGVEATPDLLATLGIGAVTDGVGAPAYLAARNLGQTADQRMTNDNQQGPADTAHLLGAVPAAALEAAIGTGGAGFGAVGKAIGRLPGAAQPVAKVASEAVANAANDAVAQLGTSVGTEKGAQLDPTEVAVAGAQGAASRAATVVPEVVARATGAAVNQAMARMQPAIDDPAQAASIVRVGQELQDATQQAIQADGELPAANVLLSRLKSTKAADLKSQLDNLRDAGAITGEQNTMLRAGLEQAWRHNNTLDPDVLGLLEDMQLDPTTKAALTTGFRDLNTLSTQSFEKNLQGPLEQLGRTIGRFAGIAHGTLTGNPLEAGIGLLLGSSHGPGAAIGGALGRVGDRAFGTQLPDVVLQQMRAKQALATAGIKDVGPTSAAQLAALRANPQDPNAGLRAQLGVDADTGPSAAQRAQQQSQIETAGRQRELQALQDAQQGSLNSSQPGLPIGLARIAQAARARQAAEQAAKQFEADYAAAKDEDAQRGVQFRQTYADAVAENRQRDQQEAFQRSQEIGDAQAIDRQRAQFAALHTKATADNERLATMNEREADKVSGWAYDALGAREARNGGKFGAKATDAQASPAYRSSGGAYGAPAGEAPLVRPGTTAPTPRTPPEASRKAAQAPEAAPATTPAAKPQEAPSGRPTGSQGHVGTAPPEGYGFLYGPKAYVHKALADHGVPSTAGDFHQALTDMVTNGTLARVLEVSPDHPGLAKAAEAIARNQTELRGPAGRRVMNAIAAQIAHSKGLLGNLDKFSDQGANVAEKASAAQAPQTGIRDIPRWMAKREDNKQHVEALARAEEAKGNTDLARVLRSAGNLTLATEKDGVLDGYLKTLPKGPGQDAYYNHAKAVLSDPTIRKGK